MAAVYLTVPYKDKDIVKALGARWDGKNRKWFVPEENASRFSRWVQGAESGLSAGAAPPRYDSLVEQSPLERLGGGERVGASLSSVLFEASEAIKKSLPVPRWLIAEVASIRTHPHSKHTYMELVEHDDAGREMAKASARIWAGSARILRRFEKDTGGAVVEGMKVLVLAQADFSIQYGFGLTVEDIDTAWTLGEMQRKVHQIRERLVAEGLIDLNKSLRPAADFVSVAVVAPDGAAGLGDFMADAKVLAGAGLCVFHFLPAVFEGASALGSICAALATAHEMARRGELDAVVIVRGGGAKTSLNWLNEYEIAALVCALPVPAMVGVGHERDGTVLDEVACESFDTPSKAVGAIASRVLGNARTAVESLAEVRALTSQACARASSATMALRSSVELRARSAVASSGAELNGYLAEVRALTRSCLRSSRDRSESLLREVVGLGPSASMRRGYSVVTQNGQARGRASQLDVSQPVVLHMADGEVKLMIIEKGGEK